MRNKSVINANRMLYNDKTNRSLYLFKKLKKNTYIYNSRPFSTIDNTSSNVDQHQILIIVIVVK